MRPFTHPECWVKLRVVLANNSATIDAECSSTQARTVNRLSFHAPSRPHSTRHPGRAIGSSNTTVVASFTPRPPFSWESSPPSRGGQGTHAGEPNHFLVGTACTSTQQASMHAIPATILVVGHLTTSSVGNACKRTQHAASNA